MSMSMTLRSEPVQSRTIEDRFRQLISPERGYYWRAIRLGLTPTQAIIYAVRQHHKVNRLLEVDDANNIS